VEVGAQRAGDSKAGGGCWVSWTAQAPPNAGNGSHERCEAFARSAMHMSDARGACWRWRQVGWRRGTAASQAR